MKLDLRFCGADLGQVIIIVGGAVGGAVLLIVAVLVVLVVCVAVCMGLGKKRFSNYTVQGDTSEHSGISACTEV